MRHTVLGLGLCLFLGSCAIKQAFERAVLPVAAEPVDTKAVMKVTTNPQRFAQAYGWLRDEQYEPALTAFAQLTTTYPILADYHLFYAGVIHARQGELDAAQAAFTRLLAAYPDSVKSDEASLELGRILLQRREYATASTFLERAAASEQPWVRDPGRLALAKVFEQRGDIARANENLMAIRRGARGTVAAREAKQAVLSLRRRYRQLEPAGGELFGEVNLLLEERDYPGAAVAVARLQKSPLPGADPAAIARLDAETMLGRGRFDDGLAALWKVADDYPRSSASPPALFRLASLLWNKDRDAAAMRAFRELHSRYPQDRRVPDALYAIARIHNSAGRDSGAITAYLEVVRRFPRNDLAAESKWRIGWIHYRAGRWEDAAISFADLAGSSSGKRHDEAMYWRARAHENAGRGDRARQLYSQIIANPADSPYAAYYTSWSEVRVAILSRRARPAATPFANDDHESIKAPAKTEPVVPPSLPSYHVERWRQLRTAGLNELARAELVAIERGGRDDPETVRFLINSYQSVDDFRRARALVNRRSGRAAGLSARERRELLYPLGFWDEVDQEAKARQLDPIWVISLMRQESTFDPDARSPADARGLMQLLPSTATRVAREIGSGLDADADLAQPGVNIRLGTAYLRILSDRYDGDMLKVLAAYNGGEPAVDRWQQQFGTLAPDEFVESITYRETRDYVKRVAGNYRVYRKMYGAPPS